MADKKAIEKRQFYKEKIWKIRSQLNDESVFAKISLYELNEFSNALTTAYEKFELKCLAVSCDAELVEKQALKKINEENETIDNQYIKLKAKLNKRIDQIKSEGKEDALEEEKNAFEDQIIQEEKRQLQNTWGFFNGKIEAFSQFYASFTNAINSEKDLSEDEKYNLLLQACQNEAKNAVANLSYEEALKNLENIYGCAYRQMQYHMRKLLNIKPVMIASANNLQAFYNEICECEDAIKKCVQEEKGDHTMTFVLIEKLDKETSRV